MHHGMMITQDPARVQSTSSCLGFCQTYPPTDGGLNPSYHSMMLVNRPGLGLESDSSGALQYPSNLNHDDSRQANTPLQGHKGSSTVNILHEQG